MRKSTQDWARLRPGCATQEKARILRDSLSNKFCFPSNKNKASALPYGVVPGGVCGKIVCVHTSVAQSSLNWRVSKSQCESVSQPRSPLVQLAIPDEKVEERRSRCSDEDTKIQVLLRPIRNEEATDLDYAVSFIYSWLSISRSEGKSPKILVV